MHKQLLITAGVILFFVIPFIIPMRLYGLPTSKNTQLQAAYGFEQRGNFYEAITEYRRALFYFSDTSSSHDPLSLKEQTQIRLHIGDLYFKSANYQAAQAWYQKEPSYQNKLRLIDVTFALHQDIYPAVLSALELVGDDPLEAGRLKVEVARAFIARGNYTIAKQLVQEPLASNEIEPVRIQLEQALQSKPQYYSAWRMLFGVIPGGAFASIHEYKHASLSFLTVGALGTISAVALVQGYAVGGFLAGMFAFRYYLDSLYLSFQMLRTANTTYEKQYQNKILQNTGGAISFAGRDAVFYFGQRFSFR